MMNLKIKIHLPSIIGRGYKLFWHCKKRFRVLKGGRGSKKSTTMALWLIYMIMKYPLSNAVVVRAHLNTHKDSTYAQLKWAAERLGVLHLWKFPESKLEATFIPTGQKILFRGFDDVLKLTSITVPHGILCWAWIEEAYEIQEMESFKTFVESIRGELPRIPKKSFDNYKKGEIYLVEPNMDDKNKFFISDDKGNARLFTKEEMKEYFNVYLWKQITLTYNPWVNSHWTKEMFWDIECRKDTDRFTTDHRCNEFLSEEDHEMYESLMIDDPERGRVVARGEYGVPGGVHFSEFRKAIHVIEPFILNTEWKFYNAIDYGFDMLAGLWFAIDFDNNVYCFNETEKPELIISEASDHLNKINGKRKLHVKFGPPDLKKRGNDTGEPMTSVFTKNNWSFQIAGNGRAAGTLAIKELLKVIEKLDPVTGEVYKTARLQIFSNCRILINHLSDIKTDETDPNCYATKPHYLTHIVDALRYFAIMIVSAPQKEIQHIPDDYEEYVDEMNDWG